MVLNDDVYDISMYMKYHPGGIETLLEGAGTDATDLFSYIN
jgi:cytochrome-b5 reductase